MNPTLSRNTIRSSDNFPALYFPLCFLAQPPSVGWSCGTLVSPYCSMYFLRSLKFSCHSCSFTFQTNPILSRSRIRSSGRLPLIFAFLRVENVLIVVRISVCQCLPVPDLSINFLVLFPLNLWLASRPPAAPLRIALPLPLSNRYFSIG